jgi:hypothetical protein
VIEDRLMESAKFKGIAQLALNLLAQSIVSHSTDEVSTQLN